jgi:hypothetical protein
MANEYSREVKLVRLIQNDSLIVRVEGDNITVAHKIPPQDTSHTHVNIPPMAHLSLAYLEQYAEIFTELKYIVLSEEDDVPF